MPPFGCHCCAPAGLFVSSHSKLNRFQKKLLLQFVGVVVQTTSRPLEIVSKPLQTAALAFPSGWAMKTLHGLISFGQGLGALSLNVVALVGFAAVFGVIASRSLRID